MGSSSLMFSFPCCRTNEAQMQRKKCSRNQYNSAWHFSFPYLHPASPTTTFLTLSALCFVFPPVSGYRSSRVHGCFQLFVRSTEKRGLEWCREILTNKTHGNETFAKTDVCGAKPSCLDPHKCNCREVMKVFLPEHEPPVSVCSR